MSHAPFLLIDAGNSRIKWALASADGTRRESGTLVHGEADGAGSAGFVADPHLWAALPTPGSAWLSNVAGEAVGARVAALVEARWPDLPLNTVRAAAAQCGVINRYTTPQALGSDRWAGMIGARAAYPGEHLLIATFGTATTLEALHADGRFTGGLIAPGWSMMMRSLGERTANLPTLDAADASELRDGAPTVSFANDTPRAISNACALAQAALIERMWAELQDEWGAPVRLVVSGGAADQVTVALKVPHTRHDSLVLSGLATIAADCARPTA